MADPNALAWDCLHKTGEVQIGWGYDGRIDKDQVMDEEKLTEDQFYEKYGEKVITNNHVTAEDFARELEGFRDSAVSPDLRKDLQTMSELIRLAAETHFVGHLVELSHYLHDMDYFLLSYRLDQQLPYMMDPSTAAKYYGVLSVYQ